MAFKMIPQSYVFLFLFIFGACIASFLVSFVDNYKNALSPFTRSKCDYCKNSLKYNNLIPIFSYLIQKGKCHSCKNNIKINYLIYELLLALCLPLSWLISSELNFSSQIFIGFIVIILCYTVYLDWEKMLISIPALILFFIFSILLFLFSNSFNQDILISKLIGLFVGYISLWGINKIYKIIRKRDGIGEGDPLLFAVIGFFVGIEFLFYILILSSITGAIYGIILVKYYKGSVLDRVPFGSFLAVATIVIYFYKMLYY